MLRSGKRIWVSIPFLPLTGRDFFVTGYVCERGHCNLYILEL